MPYGIGFLNTYSQDLPQNPEPGKCYVRCTTPDIYVKAEEKKLKVIKQYPKFAKKWGQPAKWGKEY